MSAKKTAASFLIALAACFVLELGTILIPRTAIQRNFEKTALFYKDRFLYPELFPHHENTTIDYRSDTVLMNVIYEMDEKSPVLSLIKASYYESPEGRPDTELMEAVFSQKPGNASYGRYWHGSMVLLRPLFLFTDIEGIYRILKLALLSGVVTILCLMLHRREYRTLCCFLTAFLLTGGLLMATCVQYANVILVTLCMIPLFLRALDKDANSIYCLCAVDGVVTCFLDFLTAETITITIPLLCMLCSAEKRSRADRMRYKLPGIALRGLVIWGMAYGGMFAVKWVLCSLLLGRDSAMDILAKAGFRIQGNPLLAMIRNIQMLLPLTDTAKASVETGFVLVWVLALLAVTAVLFRRFPVRQAAAYMTLALVPYLRFAVLSEHSIQHTFYTYRIQMATVFVMTLAVSECAERIAGKYKWGIQHEKEKPYRTNQK